METNVGRSPTFSGPRSFVAFFCREANRKICAAKERGDHETAEEIKKLCSYLQESMIKEEKFAEFCVGLRILTLELSCSAWAHDMLEIVSEIEQKIQIDPENGAGGEK